MVLRRLILLIAGLIWMTSAWVGATPAKSANAAPRVGHSTPGTEHRTLIESRPATGLPGWETRLYLIEYGPGAAAPVAFTLRAGEEPFRLESPAAAGRALKINEALLNCTLQMNNLIARFVASMIER